MFTVTAVIVKTDSPGPSFPDKQYLCCPFSAWWAVLRRQEEVEP